MFVTSVIFSWKEASSTYVEKTGNYEPHPGHWSIQATLNDKPTRYGGHTMSLRVEQGIGQKLAEVLLPVIIADASRKSSRACRRQQENA